MHTKGKLQFLLSNKFSQKALPKPSPGGEVRGGVSTSELEVNSSGPAAKSRGLGLGFEFRQSAGRRALDKRLGQVSY